MPCDWLVYTEFLLRTGLMIANIEGIMKFSEAYYVPPGPRVRERDKKGKKRRFRKEPWYKRAIRRRQRQRFTSTNRQISPWPWEDTEEDWWDQWFDLYRHRFLRYQHYGKEYVQWVDKLNCANPLAQHEQLLMRRTYRCITSREESGFFTMTGEATLSESQTDDRYHWMDDLDGDSNHHVAFVNGKQIEVVFDTGATISISPNKDDFVSWEASQKNLTISGITNKASVCGVGQVEWTVHDDNGNEQRIATRAYYVPAAQIRLFSPQAYFRDRKKQQTANDKSWFGMNPDGYMFVWENGAKRTIRWSDRRGDLLPTMNLQGLNVQKGYSVVDDENNNLSTAQKELLKWHYKLSHLGLPQVQSLFRKQDDNDAILGSLTRSGQCDLPKCTACSLAKAHKISTNVKTTTIKSDKVGVLSRDHLRPGQLISVDQFESSVRGRLLTSKGKEKQADRYKGGTVFYDHASGYISVKMQVSFDAASTIEAKHSFERTCGFAGIDIDGYRSDQGIFKSEAFQKDLKVHGQTIDFSAVGGKHQNGAAERAIRTISDLARANLLHAQLHWPDKTDLSLWPMAVDYAVYIYNNTPRKDTKLAPIEIWTGCKSNYQVLRSAHVWGCPVYVLEPKLQDGKKIPKWQPRSRRGQFLGRSTKHASSAALIENVTTGSISTQFHVVFDDWFATVSSTNSMDDVEHPDEWEEIVIKSREKIIDDTDDAPPLSDEWLTKEEIEKRDRYVKERELRRRRVPTTHRRAHVPEGVQAPIQEDEEPNVMDNDEEFDGDGDDHVPEDNVDVVPLRRSTRTVKRPKRYWNDDVDIHDDRLFKNASDVRNITTDWVNHLRSAERDFGLLNDEECFIANLGNFLEDTHKESPSLKLHKALILANTDEEGLLMDLHPLAFAAKANSEDLPNFHQAMNGPDAEGYLKAMDLEIEQLLEKDPWEVVSIESIPGKNILDSTWAFCRKRYPDGRVRKLKARWCVRGDQQLEGVDFFDTYAPVVAWSTVRLLLILTVTLSLETKQVDFTLGFIHAPLHDEVYVQMPRLYEKPGHVLRLKRSIYGLKQSPLNFFNRVKEGMEARGFIQHSELDPCLFISDKVICLTYVDDCLYFSRTTKAIDDAIALLGTDVEGSAKFDIKIEEDVAGYLGILMKKLDDGTIELLQTGLIDRILKTMGLEDSKPVSTPALKEPLLKDEFGAPCQETWSYASVVGMMMYLGSNSRPEIAFAVHAAARHTHSPKRSHEIALKRIARYLKGTRNKGMIVRPTQNCQLDLFVDADFAGLWNIQEADDPVTLRSRTGFVATLGGNPILWGSKLQTEIALSTTEAEYIAASTAMRAFIPLRRMVHTLLDKFGITIPEDNNISIVWEDNNGVIKMVEAEYPNMTPRSKHIAIKYHWFREHLNTKFDGATVRMQRIDTTDQLADIFTKGIQGEDFNSKRKRLMGWDVRQAETRGTETNLRERVESQRVVNDSVEDQTYGKNQRQGSSD